jgi:glycosyltransferase involved in cell wall biosynthesis
VDRYPVGSQTFVTGEVDELRRQGEAVAVLSLLPGDASGPRPDLVLSEVTAPRWRLRLVHARWLLLSPRRYRTFRRRVLEMISESGEYGGTRYFDWRALPLVATELRARNVDVLHAHFAWAGAAVAYCLAGLTDLPWTLTVHANDIFGRRRNLQPKLDSCSRLITVCEYNVRYLREELGVTRDIDVVMCGVRVPPAEDVTREIDVVAVGRLVPKKGFDTLVRAVAEIPPSRRPKVEIVGEGAERLSLEKLVDELGVADHVALAGSLPHEAVLARIAQARLLCLPARIADDGDRDSMPVVVKEAMARCVPVVATREVAIPEMVDERVGRLVPPDDAVALACALGEVLSLPEDSAAQLGAAARARVIELFTLEGETARLRAILRETAGRAGSSSP